MYLTEEEYLALLGRLDILEKKKLKVDDLPMNDIAASIQDQADWKGTDVLLKKSVTQSLLKDDAVGTAARQAVPACRVTRAAVQATVNGVAGTIAWDTEIKDVFDMRTTGTPTLVTITEPGWYMVAGSMEWDSITAIVGRVFASILQNGSSVCNVESPPTSNGLAALHPGAIIYCAAGDTISMQWYQDTGTNDPRITGASIAAIWLSK